MVGLGSTVIVSGRTGADARRCSVTCCAARAAAAYGELVGGTVKAGAGGTLVLENNATLDGVTWQAPLTFAASQSLYDARYNLHLPN